jgi:hypothetical protein
MVEFIPMGDNESTFIEFTSIANEVGLTAFLNNHQNLDLQFIETTSGLSRGKGRAERRAIKIKNGHRFAARTNSQP